MKKEMLYLWLSCLDGMNYMLYIRLLSVFENLNSIYELSHKKEEIKKMLYEKNIFLSEKLLIQLTSDKLKEFVKQVSLELEKKQIWVISMESSWYPKEFFQMYAPPFCMLAYGDFNLLKQKIVYLHHEEFNGYGSQIYRLLQDFLKKQKVTFIKEYQNFLSETNQKDCSKIFVNCNVFLQNTFFSKESNFFLKLFDLNFSSKNSLYLFIPNVSCFDVIGAMAKLCIIPQAKFSQEKYLKNLVDVFIEYQKEVLVVPGNINSKYSYFSNYLIKEGAEILLNKKDLSYYLEK